MLERDKIHQTDYILILIKKYDRPICQPLRNISTTITSEDMNGVDGGRGPTVLLRTGCVEGLVPDSMSGWFTASWWHYKLK